MATEENSALTGLVKGRVQGVCFRIETQRQAAALGVSGWVRNTPDGDVEVLIAGPDAVLQPMLRWLREGPEMAQVTALELRECECPQLQDFQILY